MTPASGGVALRHPIVDSVAARLDDVRDRIAAAGGDADRITIVAVTKGFGPDAVHAALQGGLHDIGENYAQELEAKAEAVASETTGSCRWHLLGRVQRNKVRRVASTVSLWQALDRPAAGEEIAARAPGASVLVQVNISGEPRKSGCTFDGAPALIEHLGGLGLDVRGVMAVGPGGPPEAARPGFRRLATLARRLDLPVVSMGMTHDLEVAVQEGTTMVRVGRALFGERPLPPARRR